MALDTEVGLSTPHCARWEPSSPPKKGDRAAPNFRLIFIMANWLDASRCHLVIGMEVGLSPGDFVLDGDPVPLPQKGRSPLIFGPCLLWPNGCMDQDAAWY